MIFVCWVVHAVSELTKDVFWLVGVEGRVSGGARVFAGGLGRTNQGSSLLDEVGLEVGAGDGADEEDDPLRGMVRRRKAVLLQCGLREELHHVRHLGSQRGRSWRLEV